MLLVKFAKEGKFMRAFELSTKWEKITGSTHKEMDGNLLWALTILTSIQQRRRWSWWEVMGYKAGKMVLIALEKKSLRFGFKVFSRRDFPI